MGFELGSLTVSDDIELLGAVSSSSFHAGGGGPHPIEWVWLETGWLDGGHLQMTNDLQQRLNVHRQGLVGSGACTHWRKLQ